MQTRRQFLIGFTLTVVLLSILVVFLALELVVINGEGILDTTCCVSVVILVFAVYIVIYWKVGREGAEEFGRDADKED